MPDTFVDAEKVRALANPNAKNAKKTPLVNVTVDHGMIRSKAVQQAGATAQELHDYLKNSGIDISYKTCWEIIEKPKRTTRRLDMHMLAVYMFIVGTDNPAGVLKVNGTD